MAPTATVRADHHIDEVVDDPLLDGVRQILSQSAAHQQLKVAEARVAALTKEVAAQRRRWLFTHNKDNGHYRVKENWRFGLFKALELYALPIGCLALLASGLEVPRWILWTTIIGFSFAAISVLIVFRHRPRLHPQVQRVFFEQAEHSNIIREAELIVLAAAWKRLSVFHPNLSPLWLRFDYTRHPVLNNPPQKIRRRFEMLAGPVGEMDLEFQVRVMLDKSTLRPLWIVSSWNGRVDRYRFRRDEQNHVAVQVQRWLNRVNQ